MSVHPTPSSLRDRRRLFLDIVKRRVRPGTGGSRQFLETRIANQTWPDLTTILKEIPWCVVGAVATRTYMPYRATQDLADLSRMLGLASVELRNQTRAIFREWEPGGLGDLESLIALGELEMGVD